jgi:hypothetical protein
MKTQINDIKRGNQFVSGTSYRIRYERAKTVLSENGDTLKLTYNGVEITLELYKWWYGGVNLTDEQIKALFPDDTKYNHEPELVSYYFCLSSDCTATITRYRRKSIQATWKPGYEYRLDNNDIVIL